PVSVSRGRQQSESGEGDSESIRMGGLLLAGGGSVLPRQHAATGVLFTSGNLRVRAAIPAGVFEVDTDAAGDRGEAGAAPGDRARRTDLCVKGRSTVSRHRHAGAVCGICATL